MVKLFSLAIFLLISSSIVFAGPEVVPHPKSNNTVNVRDTHTGVVLLNIRDESTISQLQGMFKRAKKVGDTISHLRTYSHDISFSDHWIINIGTGEIGIMRKMVSDVYQLEAEDLKKFQQYIQGHSKTSELSPTVFPTGTTLLNIQTKSPEITALRIYFKRCQVFIKID